MIAEQMSLEQALAERERGMTAAIEHAEPDYRDRVWSAIEELAATGRPWDADDLRERVGETPAGYSPNLIGALINAASTKGLIEFQGFTRSMRRVGHGNRLAVWKRAS